MPDDIILIPAAAVLCFVLFVSVDILFRLPKKGGVSGASAIAKAIARDGGDLSGGTMMGNIVCSPDASAGTLLAACGVYAGDLAGNIGPVPGGIAGGLCAAVLVFFGNRICHDPGYAGTTGAVLATFMVSCFSSWVFSPDQFIAGMVIAILLVQGLSHPAASRFLGRLWRIRS